MNKIGQNISVVGTVGVPGIYGGFETLAENLVKYHAKTDGPETLSVYCSARAYPKRPAHFMTAALRYIPLDANGFQSIPYDVWSLFDTTRRDTDVILLLGVSGAVALPFIRLVSSTYIVTNIDGIEWRRNKWRGLAKWFLRLSEMLAVRYSHKIIADNQGIADYISETYNKPCQVIAYGGDHAISVEPASIASYDLPVNYALSLCRIEPENNTHVILEAFIAQTELPLVFIGNWKSSEYGQLLLDQYGKIPHLYLLGPIYDLRKLRAFRSGARIYIHGHSAGGTNPSLVEMMHFGIPILAYDCTFNRYTTEDKAMFFKDASNLLVCLKYTNETFSTVGNDMLAIAQKRYTWEKVGEEYFNLLTGTS